MEEARCEAVFPDNSTPVLMFQVIYHVCHSIKYSSARGRGNCAQCSTELTPMIEFCGECSIHLEVAWVEPLLEQDLRCERRKSVLPLFF